MEQKILLKEKKEIKLLVDAHVFDGIYQGSRTFLKGVYSNFDSKKYSIRIYLAANNLENLREEFLEIKDIEFIKLKYRNKYLRLIFEIPSIISKLKIDFAHFNYYLPLFLNRNCKYIVTIHDVLFLDFRQYFGLNYYLKNKLLFSFSAKRADILTTVSKYSSDRLKENFKIHNKKIHILPNAIGSKFHLDYDKRLSIEHIKNKYKTQNFLLYVSRLEPRKNHLMLLNVYEDLELWNQGIELVFIGKRAFNNDKVENKMEQLNIRSNNKVHLFEFVEENDLVLFYKSCLISVFPSICEGFGIPPLESGALKIPTICSNVTAMKEFTFFEEFHINPENEYEFKQAILLMLMKLKNKTMENYLCQVSNEIIKKYNWKKTATTLGKVINEHFKQKLIKD